MSCEKNRCLIIGEVAQAHDGSLGFAHAFIDAIGAAGADAVKFQTHIAEAESSPAESWRVKFSYQDATRFDYWKRTSFREHEWRQLCTHARDRGLLFLSSPFSVEAAEMLQRLGVPAWKVASGEFNNIPLFDYMLATAKPVFLSTGMSRLREIDAAVAAIQKHGNPLTVLQCTSAYPCPAENVGLNLIPFYRDRYGSAVGLSDHSGAIFPGLAATVLGIGVLEVHVTLSREMFGPDVPASLTTGELRQLVAGVRYIESMMASPVDKDRMAEELDGMRVLFSKSVVLRRALPAGARLRRMDLGLRKPGTGIPGNRIDDLVGRTLRQAAPAGHFVADEDLLACELQPVEEETVAP